MQKFSFCFESINFEDTWEFKRRTKFKLHTNALIFWWAYRDPEIIIFNGKR